MKICKIAGVGQSAFVDDELIMIHVDTGKFFTLEHSGLEIWHMLDTENDLEVICAALERKYAVESHACRAELREFAQQLVEAGFARYC